jgi:hypothetical protein
MRGGVITAAIAAAVVSFFAFLPVFAHNWGSGVWAAPSVGCLDEDYRSECTADNNIHTVYIYTYVVDPFESWIEESVEHDFVFGDGEFSASRVSSVTNDTDAIVVGATIPESIPNWLYTTCQLWSQHGGGTGQYEWCEPQVLRIDPNRANNESNCLTNENCMRRLACHEIGHTTGLQHPGKSPDATSPDRETCMEYKDGQSNPHDLDNHDREHLTDCYLRPQSNPPTLTPSCRQTSN